MFALVAALVLLVMIVVTGSRAGMLVGFASLAASLAMAPMDELGMKLSRRNALILRFAVVAVPLAVVFLLVVFGKAVAIDRLIDDDLMAEQRVAYFPLLLELSRTYLPFGSGYGTFDPVYRSFEPDWAITTKYLNHAHNDLLELADDGRRAGHGGARGICRLDPSPHLGHAQEPALDLETISPRAPASIMAVSPAGRKPDRLSTQDADCWRHSGLSHAG